MRRSRDVATWRRKDRIERNRSVRGSVRWPCVAVCTSHESRTQRTAERVVCALRADSVGGGGVPRGLV
jgi:hypothetical protein